MPDGTPPPHPEVAATIRLARRVLFGVVIGAALFLTLLLVGAALIGDDDSASGVVAPVSDATS